ncbi:hypothetical protein ETU10_00050 [Apibacter muscae]|uniref:hypothetical protein n=1 Tax=Apibacter muscae TaxID=2509004 RepID=UPI0011AC0615|nr:hypothetical protein [Apibacter muscae]TWP25431.1 hypothetical protein ETU10_00050 [Apibacter muscae]
MKSLIHWDKNIFDGEKRLLPSAKVLHTQIHFPELNEAWSIAFKFNISPRDQGYRSIADEVFFLSEKAPKDVLKEGFKFSFLDGANVIGECLLFEEKIIEIEDIIERIKLIDQEKHELKMFIASMNNNSYSYTTDELYELIKYSIDYPYIFSFVLNIDKNIALEYLSKHYLVKLNNVLESSNLPLFLFNIEKVLGKEEFDKFIEKLPKEIKENEIFINSIDEIL